MSETYTADMRRDLRVWGTPIRDELQEAFTLPAMRLADRIDEFVEQDPRTVNKIAGWRPVDPVPYSCHDLPPNLYDNIKCNRPFIPETDDDLDRLMDGFWQSNLRLHATTLGFHAHATFPDHKEYLADTLRHRREAGLDIDPADWEAYQQTYRRQLERGFFTLGHNSAIMNIRSIFDFAAERGTFDFAKGRHSSYLMTALSSPHQIGLYLRAPEGGYGREAAERFIRTTSFLSDFVEQDKGFNADMWRSAAVHYDVLSKHTLRATVNKVLYGVEESASVVTQEGWMSMLAMMNLATAEKINGLPKVGQAVAQIEKDDIINKVTLLLPLGVAGATSAFGIYFPGIMQYSESGLEFDRHTMGVLEVIRKTGSVIMHREWSDYIAQGGAEGGTEPPVRTGLTCPLAGPYKNEGIVSPGVVSRFTTTFRKVFDAIELGSVKPDKRGVPWEVPRLSESPHFKEFA